MSVRTIDARVKTHQPAPLPYDWMTSETVPAGGSFHLYLTDANGRKIAAIWGAPGEKEETAKLLVRATQTHAALVEALKPFAAFAPIVEASVDSRANAANDVSPVMRHDHFRLSDFRRAVAALELASQK